MDQLSNVTGDQIDVTGRENIPPHAHGLINALREIGYKFDQAIADLVDNSITASATQILVRFITKDDSIAAIVVADDGVGMDSGTLTEAMRFGAREMRPLQSLGKYGVGLKLASLSKARCLTVYSRQGGVSGGRRWSVDEISKNGWVCGKLEEEGCAEQLDSSWGPINLAVHGTIVEWSDIDKLPISPDRLDASLRKISTGLERHLGLYFHRFLENEKPAIYIDRQELGGEPHMIRARVAPLNPFPERSGHTSYPTAFGFELDGIGRIRAKAHIWPANSKETRYKLPGGAARAQGFYIYRNDRLIQAGGWNGIVDDDREPHGSLARVRIDLPPEMDGHFSLNVQKADVTVPPNFVDAVLQSRGDNGHTFKKYRSTAQEVYRQKDDGAIKQLHLVPQGGLPDEIKVQAEKLLAPDADEYRDVDVLWKDLKSADLVEIDRPQRTIYINRRYRRDILGSRKAKKNDVPLLKALIFFLVRSYLDRNMSSKRKSELDQMNSLLAACAMLGEG